MSDGKKLPVVGQRDPLERLLAGDSAGVIEDLKARLATDEHDDVVWLQLATAYAHIAHWPDAAAAYARAVDLDGSILEARRGYARALTRLRKLDEATFQLVQAKRLAPDDARVAHELGIAFYDKRLFDKSLRELIRGRDLAPDDARIRYAMGLAYEAKSQMADAIACYRAAVRLSPEDVAVRQTLADALAAMGELAAAIEELAQAQARDRSNAQIANNLDILKKGLAELEATRLIGKTTADLERSAVIELGKLERLEDTHRYRNELVEIWAELDDEEHITSLMLLLTDPDRAAKTIDDTFQITVVSESGDHVPANLATAATLTFLREALGCPLTRAGELYAKLLEMKEPVRWAGSLLSLAEVDGRAGVLVKSG